MGMDVYTRQEPETKVPEVGRYFRRNVWGWRPLAEALDTLAPENWTKIEYRFSNDGDGLDGDDARALAAEIDEAVKSGAAAQYVAERDARIAAMPPLECWLCKGTGVRTDQVGRDMGMVERGWCNGCDGKGTTPPWDASYHVEVRDFTEFAEFARWSGGFSIY